jgi:hypothetical protein
MLFFDHYDMIDPASGLPLLGLRYGSARPYFDPRRHTGSRRDDRGPEHAHAIDGAGLTPEAEARPADCGHGGDVGSDGHRHADSDCAWCACVRAGSPRWTGVSPLAQAFHIVLILAMVALIGGAAVLGVVAHPA